MTSDSRNSLRRHDPDQVWTVGAASAPSQPDAPDSREGRRECNSNYQGASSVPRDHPTPARVLTCFASGGGDLITSGSARPISLRPALIAFRKGLPLDRR